MIRCMPPSPPWPSWTVGAHCWTWQRHGKPPRLPLPPSPPPAPPVLLAPLIGGINGGPGAPRPTSTTALLPQLGITGCPVAALTAYLTLHRAMPAPASHPLFINPDGSFTREHVPCDLRAHASHCGLYPAQVSSHGLRIGSAWTMANEGVPIATIQVLGRWKCDLMPLLYCRMSLDRLALATRALRLSTANVHVELYPPLPPPSRSPLTTGVCVHTRPPSLPPPPLPPSFVPSCSHGLHPPSLRHLPVYPAPRDNGTWSFPIPWAPAGHSHWPGVGQEPLIPYGPGESYSMLLLSLLWRSPLPQPRFPSATGQVYGIVPVPARSYTFVSSRARSHHSPPPHSRSALVLTLLLPGYGFRSHYQVRECT